MFHVSFRYQSLQVESTTLWCWSLLFLVYNGNEISLQKFKIMNFWLHIVMMWNNLVKNTIHLEKKIVKGTISRRKLPCSKERTMLQWLRSIDLEICVAFHTHDIPCKSYRCYSHTNLNPNSKFFKKTIIFVEK